MSGFIVRIPTVVYLLVILYSRQSSADFWDITSLQPAKVVLPDDPNDPYYDSKSVFFLAIKVNSIASAFVIQIT